MENYINPKLVSRVNIGLLLIASNKYLEFIPPLLESADQYFFNNTSHRVLQANAGLTTYKVTYFLFTDRKEELRRGPRELVKNFVPHKPWPYMTLERYKIFSDHKKALSKMDYLYYCDADMRFADDVGAEILEERVATMHPGCFLHDRGGDPERNPDSLAFISHDEQIPDCYKCGGFNGGSAVEFLKMSETLAKNIEIDHEKGIIAKWHDESHLNRYMLDNPPTKVLTPSYCFAEGYPLPFPPRLLALNKDHNEIRS